jgi:Ca2+-transporting ATPase
VLRRPPRDPHEPIIKKSDVKRYTLESLSITAATMAGYAYGVSRYGIGPRSSTIAFMTLTSGQLLHALSCRSEARSVFSKEQLQPNRYLQMALGGSAALQMLTVMVPGLRSLLGTTLIGPMDALVIAAGAGLPLVFNELTKEDRSQLARPDAHSKQAAPVSD